MAKFVSVKRLQGQGHNPEKCILSLSSGEDGFSVYWKLIVVDDCLETN
jgi:hypothetical protein